jgi:hypothetical protein
MNDLRFEELRTKHVDHSLWKSLLVGFEIAGKWWFSFWLLILLSGIITFVVSIANIKNIDSRVWIVLLVMGLFIAPVIACHKLRIERDKYKALWDDKNIIISILSDLEDLRKTATSLQIEGMKLTNQTQLDVWKIKVEQWTKETYEKVLTLHPADAGNFLTLGLFKGELAVGTQPFMIKNSQVLLNLIRRIHILEEIRDRWTIRNILP